MSAVSRQSILIDQTSDSPIKIRRESSAHEPIVLTDIYKEDVNIVTWKRDLPESLKNSARQLSSSKPNFQVSMTVSSDSAFSSLNEAFGSDEYLDLAENITELVDMFSYLFERRRVGLRLTVLNKAMCPRFHVDKVPCRLITTYQGIATEWLPQHQVNRNKLGIGSQGLADSESGLYHQAHDIQQLSCGDVALLKGENWIGNENAGLIHRSPAVAAGENRLLLTLDFSE